MLLLDTNVLIYACTRQSSWYEWARQVIAESVASKGAAINAIALAEFCVGASQPEIVAHAFRSWGLQLMDVPAAIGPRAAEAYQRYRTSTDKPTPAVPLPDFFIGAHADVFNWPLATADKGRFKTYFPNLELVMPH